MSPTGLNVEDDEILRPLTVEAISLLGLCVIDCACADDALPMLEDSISIALVITDIRLPGKTNVLPDSTWPTAHCGTWS